jgi:hypothetical protein
MAADRLRLAPVPPPLEISAKFPDTAVSLHRCSNALRQPYEATDMLADFELGRLALDGPLTQLSSPRFEEKGGRSRNGR